MNLSVVFELLQYPGLGPTSEPPLQYIFASWQSMQSPGVVKVESEYDTSASHSTHSPEVEKDSPVIQALNCTVISKSVLDLLFAVR